MVRIDGTDAVAIDTIVDDNGTPDDPADDFTPVGIVENGANIGDGDADGLLDPGEEWRFESPSGLGAAAVKGPQVNIATVNAGAVSASDPAHVYGTEGIRLDVTLNGAASAASPGVAVAAGTRWCGATSCATRPTGS